MSNRAERRRQQRQTAHQKTPVIIAGDGIVASALSGHQYEARPHAELAGKVPGRHRWVATGAWVLSDLDAAGAFDVDQMKFLDNENLMYLAIGCWDCEMPLGDSDKGIAVGSRCPAEAS